MECGNGDTASARRRISPSLRAPITSPAGPRSRPGARPADPGRRPTSGRRSWPRSWAAWAGAALAPRWCGRPWRGGCLDDGSWRRSASGGRSWRSPFRRRGLRAAPPGRSRLLPRCCGDTAVNGNPLFNVRRRFCFMGQRLQSESSYPNGNENE